MKNDKEQRTAAKEFSQRWENRGYEKGDSQIFWISLLTEVFGIVNPDTFISFENQVKLSNTSFIDAYIPSTKILIEQKSINKDLREPIKQSDGTLLTPFQQAKRYASELPLSKHPRWVVTCNFKSFLVYDMENPQGEPEEILLKNLEKEYYRLNFLVDEGSTHLKRELELSVKAGHLVGKLYELLLAQYKDPGSADTLRSLNVLCVRLVFCLYAEDAGLFGGNHSAFYDYMMQYKPNQMRKALIDLFQVMNTKPSDRDPYIDPELGKFPYCSGGLFQEMNIEIPMLTPEIAELLLEEASEGFDWSSISPTIFGAVFESTLNPETRRSGGMHYTSIENIHKVIDPLFLDDLKKEFQSIKEEPKTNKRKQKLLSFQDKLASLKFLDPACGSGNFLTETYLSLRRLENNVIKEYYQDQSLLGFEEVNPIKVDISQFYGIEINDFAVTVTATALWIAEAQTMAETEQIIHLPLEYFPLKNYDHIHEANALRIDWNDVCPKAELNYIMGNPPFVGARWMDDSQKKDVIEIFGSKWKGVGDLDYVCCWYKKAADLMNNSTLKSALVSTNSITQGGAVTNLWKPLLEDYCMRIDFAWRTFHWDSEASLKAQVHCVIVGFSENKYERNKLAKLFYSSDGRYKLCANINGYLADAENVFIDKRTMPVSSVPSINLGGQPIDDGNLVLSAEEKDSLISQYPFVDKYIRMYMMGRDFIDRHPRYCLWLKGVNPLDIRRCTEIFERVKRVKEFRLSSNRSSTLKAADTPYLFGAPFEAEDDYVAIPKVSSGNRRYIPMDYLSKDIIPGDKLFVMQHSKPYHFGILISNVHMAWMRTVCGRLKSDYSYSNTIVYNNFPWPTPTEQQKQKIEQTAQAILDARALYPDCSLADLYDEVTMPPELRKAHQQNDRAVMEAYGFPVSRDFTESDCVAKLFELYKKLTEK